MSFNYTEVTNEINGKTNLKNISQIININL